MNYNISILNFQDKECEIRVYPKSVSVDGFRCDDDGVIIERKRYEGDLMENPFTGVEEMIRDLDEMEKRRAESIRCSLYRTKSKIYQLARGEDWEWFITFTFDGSKIDRYSYDECSAFLSGWLQRIRCKHLEFDFDLKYMVVPEQHKDGAWHFHGIFANVSADIMDLYKAPWHDDYRVRAYKKGFSTAEPVKDQLAVSNYISKYITKDLVSVTRGKKRYWHTRNLHLPDRYLLDMNSMPQIRDMLTYMDGEDCYISEAEGPYGKIYYLNFKGDLDSLLDKLWPVWPGIHEMRLAANE